MLYDQILGPAQVGFQRSTDNLSLQGVVRIFMSICVASEISFEPRTSRKRTETFRLLITL